MFHRQGQRRVLLATDRTRGRGARDFGRRATGLEYRCGPRQSSVTGWMFTVLCTAAAPKTVARGAPEALPSPDALRQESSASYVTVPEGHCHVRFLWAGAEPR